MKQEYLLGSATSFPWLLGSGTTDGNVAEKITSYRDVCCESEERSQKLQPIDFAGLLLRQRRGTRNAYEPNSVPTDADEKSIAGGHRGVHIPYLQSNFGRPFDTDVYDEVSTLRKHSL